MTTNWTKNGIKLYPVSYRKYYEKLSAFRAGMFDDYNEDKLTADQEKLYKKLGHLLKEMEEQIDERYVSWVEGRDIGTFKKVLPLLA